MKKRSNQKLVEEDFNNYLTNPNIFEDIHGGDTWNDEDDEENVDIDDIDDQDLSIDDVEDEEMFEDELKKALKNEIKVPEYSRRTLVFTDRKSGEEIKGIPMAQLNDNAFLFKVNGKYKKYKLSDIEVE